MSNTWDDRGSVFQCPGRSRVAQVWHSMSAPRALPQFWIPFASVLIARLPVHQGRLAIVADFDLVRDRAGLAILLGVEVAKEEGLIGVCLAKVGSAILARPCGKLI